MFIHLHTHSQFSFLEGIPSPAELAEAAAKNGMPAVALTDRNYLTGAVEFSDACKTAGVKPILGLQLDFSAPPFESDSCGPLTLLAMDLKGWASLCRLSSAFLTGAGSTASLPFHILADHNTGLICMTGSSHGLISSWIQGGRVDQAETLLSSLRAIFPDRLYIELQRHTPGDHALTRSLADLARRAGLPIAASHAIHYLDDDQASLQRTLSAMRLNCTLTDLPGDVTAPAGASFLSSARMEAKFSDLPEAIAATLEIANRCHLDLPVGSPQYPRIPLPSGDTAIQVLREKALSGARSLYGPLSPSLADRLEHELEVIETSGYAVLFLIMEGIIQFTRQADIPSASRGSASSSLVAHCLGITTPDPIELNLYFERFLNPARHKPPDIDTDLCSRRRDEVIQHVYETYGVDQVAMVCTINRFRRRSALREVAKAYGFSTPEIKKMVDSLPRRGWGPPGRNRGSPDSPYAELVARYSTPADQSVFQSATQILGAPRHLSIHPGGVVISPGDMTDLVPTQLASKGIVITQFDLESIERMGLVKIDLLGIRGLTVLADVAEGLRRREPDAHPARLAVLDSIPSGDSATSELVRTGRTIGCFQIESPGMRATLREIQARTASDIMVALALYRPGPLTGGLKDAFVRRHLGQEEVSYLHPALEPLLAETYGVILYQEQVLRIAHDLAGLSLAEGDLLRRAMSHFDPGEQMITLKEKFVAGAFEKNAVPPGTAERVWELMAAFAGYGFPKAHAASYAQIGWRSAWCKAHYPAEFMAAVLANWGGYYRQATYLVEARRLGLRLRPPHVNYAGREFSAHEFDGEPVLFMGLDQVRDLTRRTQNRILKARPFKSLADFLSRVDPQPLEAENLIQAGALDGFGRIPDLLRSLKQRVWQSGQLPLFSEEPTPAGPDWSPAEKDKAQQAILGAILDHHQLHASAEIFAAAGYLTTGDAATRIGKRVQVGGRLDDLQRAARDGNSPGHSIALIDREGILDITIADEIYQRYKMLLGGPELCVAEGIIKSDALVGDVHLQLERVWRVKP
jgi:DNA polymerase III subunit alpha